MRTTARLDQLLAGSRQAATRVELLSTAGAVLASSEANAGTRLELVAGTVDADATRAVTRTCSVTLTDPTGTLTPAAAGDLLAPYGNELKLHAGIVDPLTGQPELVPLGVFAFDEVNASDTGGRLELALAGHDRASRVAGRLPRPYPIAAGTNYVAAIEALVRSRYPTAVFRSTPTAFTTPAVVLQEKADPWAEARRLAQAIGYRLTVDRDGEFVLEAERDAADVATVATFAEGATATTLEVRNRVTRPRYTGAVVTGEAPGVAPVRAEVWDDDPSSPTYRHGPLGEQPVFAASPLVTTAGQALAYATALWNSERRGAQRVEFTLVPDMRLDPGDGIAVTRAAVNVAGQFVLERSSFDLTQLAAMSVACEERPL